MDAFVGMRRYLAANAQIFQRLDRVEKQQLQNKLWMEQTDDKINSILTKMDNNVPKDAKPSQYHFTNVEMNQTHPPCL